MRFRVDDRVKNECDKVLGTVVYVRLGNYVVTVAWDDGMVTVEYPDDPSNDVTLATPACECGNPFSLCHPEA